MTDVLNVAFAVILLAVSGLFAARAWRAGRFSMPDRIAGLAELLGVTALFALGALSVDWTSAPVLFWVASVALVATGASGLVMGWKRRPWIRQRKRLVWRGIRLAAGVAACTSVIALALA